MGAAGYVGRVGGLAVALGVGTAIATGHGVAWAETTDSASPPSTDTSNTDPSTTGTTSVDPTTTPETSESEESKTATTTTSSNTTTNTVEPGQVSAQTNTGTTGTTATETPDESEAGEEEPTSEPTEAADPEPTETEEPPTEEPEVPEEPPAIDTAKPNNNNTAAEPNSATSALTVQSLPDPASTLQETDDVAVFADARALAAAGPINVSPMMAAQTTVTTTVALPPAAAPDLLTGVVNVVSSVVNWVLNPLAGSAPTAPAQPPLIWGLLAYARREIENFFNALAGRPAGNAMLAAAQTTTALALPPVNPRPALPFPTQVSPSTNFVDWVTGNYPAQQHAVTGTASRAPTSASSGTTACWTTRPPPSTSIRS